MSLAGPPSAHTQALDLGAEPAPPRQDQPSRLTLGMSVTLGVLAGAALTLGGPVALLGLLFALGLGAAVLVQPMRGLLLFALLAPVIPWTTVNLGIRITVSEAVLALTWIAVAWQGLCGRLRWPQGRVEHRALLLIIWSLIPLMAGEFMLHAEGSGPVNYVRWVLNVSPLFLVPLLATGPRQREHLLTCLLLGGLALMVLSLAVFVQSRDARGMIPVLETLRYAHPEYIKDAFSGDFGRMASPWVHPNSLGGMLLLLVPVAMFWGAVHTGWRRGLGWLTALLGGVGIVLSGSRGAMLCLGALIAWLAYKKVPHAARMLISVAVLGTAVVAFYPPVQERLSSLFSSKDASTDVRFDEYSRFPTAAARYPLGIGFKIDPPAPDADLLGISNLWLNYMYKLGAPGMLLFASVMAAWWREARDLGDVSRITANNALRIGSVGAVLAALMTGFIDHYYSFTQVLAAMFWLFTAISLAETRAARPAAQSEAP